ncbi:hypothetical protein ACE1MS_11840 [Lysinibacillus sp. fkY74-1]
MKNNQFDLNKYNSILESFKHIEEHSNVFMSNQYFKTLPAIFATDKKSQWNNVVFSYGYLYLQTYMYRWTTYNHYIPSVKEVKSLLGLYENDKRYNNVIKKDGILDSYNLTQTIGIKEIPVLSSYHSETPFDKELEFSTVEEIYAPLGDMYKNWMKEVGATNRTTSKKPTLAFHNSTKEEDNLGTFFAPTDFTNIPFEVFAFCMSKEDLGLDGFFIYSYIKHGNDIHGEDYQLSHRMLEKEFGGSKDTHYKRLVRLMKHGLIERTEVMEVFSSAIPFEEREASTFMVVEDVELFDKEGNVDYTKARVLTAQEYKEEFEIEEEEEEVVKDRDYYAEKQIKESRDARIKKAVIDIADLPF